MARILYVEDNGITRACYGVAFKLAGHEVTACPDYFAARRVLNHDRQFDLIITDGRYESDQRFPNFKREGCLSLLADLKAMDAKMPVVILSMEPSDFTPEKLPPECLRPAALFSKCVETDHMAFARKLPDLLKLGCS